MAAMRDKPGKFPSVKVIWWIHTLLHKRVAAMINELERQLLNFDGSAVSFLSEARTACKNSPSYLDDLVVLCFDPRPAVSDGATWILKAELNDCMNLPPELTERIIHSLCSIQSWQAALHLCQLVEKLNLTSAQADCFIEWAQTYASHSRPFLRAWSLHARVILGNRFPEYSHEAELALQAAEGDGAASVSARARQLRKLLALQGRKK